MKIKTILILTLLTSYSCKTQQTKPSPSHTSEVSSKIKQSNDLISAKNIIFLIGDGMGTSQITAAMYLNNNSTVLERFPIVGLHKTHSADDLVTDSAAGATAFATGKKTYNGAISLDENNKRFPTLLEEAEERGKATGLVATCSITHATPACYIAHNESRHNNEAIALDFLKTDIDLFIGGGKDYFDNRTEDKQDLIADLRQKEYIVEDYQINISDVNIDISHPYVYFTADKHPQKASEGRNYLKPAAIKAVNYLDQRSEEGFFVMIEGSQIDWGGHDNDADYVVNEMKAFESTIGAILDWAEKDGETLVVVTADHETGGFAINEGSTSDSLVIAFTTGGHTAEMIPVFAYGPGSKLFSGIYENTAIYDKMRKAFSWKILK